MIVPEDIAKIIGLNTLIVLLFLYLLQGLSIVQFFFRKKNIPRYLRALFYALIVLYQYLLVFISAIGLFDIWVDFRKMNRPAKDTTAVTRDEVRGARNEAPLNAGSQEARKSRGAESTSFFLFYPLFLTSDLPIFAIILRKISISPTPAKRSHQQRRHVDEGHFEGRR